MKEDKIPFWVRHWTKIVLTAIVVFTAIFLWVINWNPGNVGRFEYIGKEEVGCWLACPERPSNDYYYSTDMDRVQLLAFFKQQAKSISESEDVFYFSNYYRHIGIVTTSDEKFSLIVYDKSASRTAVNNARLDDSRQDYVIVVNEKEFSIFKKNSRKNPR